MGALEIVKWVLRLPWDSPRHSGEVVMKNAQLAAIVESSNDAILSFTLDGVATSWNPAAERMFGYSADEIIGQQSSVFVQSEKADESTDILAKIRKGQSIEHFETWRLNKDGRAVPVSMNIAPVSAL